MVKILPHYWNYREACLYSNSGCNVFCSTRRISFQPDGAESGTQLCTLNGEKRARLSGPCGGVAFVISRSITETQCSCLHCRFVYQEVHARLSAVYCSRTPPTDVSDPLEHPCIWSETMPPDVSAFSSSLSAVKLASGIESGWTIPGHLRPSGARLRQCLQAPTCGAPRARRTCPTARARGRSRRAGASTTAHASEHPFGWSRVRLLMVFL